MYDFNQHGCKFWPDCIYIVPRSNRDGKKVGFLLEMSYKNNVSNAITLVHKERPELSRTDALYQVVNDGIVGINSDKIVEGRCSKKRPDFIKYTEWGGGAIVLEVDEHQHNRKNYLCECETTRMKQIYHDIGMENVFYIRYNPDKYKPIEGRQVSDSKRHDMLVKIVKKYIEKKPQHSCSVIYLFYDGFVPTVLEEEELDPYKV